VYYRALLGEKWAPYSDDSTKLVYKAAGKSDVFITPLDYDLLQHEDSAEIVRQLASADNAYFLDQFARTWSKFVNLDRAGVSCT
jgi:catalase (peroxidase I)